MERLQLAIERARAQAAAAGTASGWVARDNGLRQPHVPGPEAETPVHVVPLDPVHLERHRIVGLQPANPLKQTFDLLRTQVLQKMQEQGWRTIAITSPSVQSGKSVVSINLAMSIAHHPSRRALLVDFDLRRPSVASYLGLPAGPSLNEVLAGEVDAASAIVHAGIPGLEVLATQRRVAGSAELLASQKVDSLIGELRDADPQRIIVLDLPPITLVDDVIAVLPKVDCVLVVVGNGSSTRQEIEESKRHLARFNVVGLVVNKAPLTRMHSSYY